MTKTKPRHGKHTKQASRARPRWVDPAIIVALIGLIGTIITVSLPSPFFSTLIQRIYPPTSVLPTATPIPFARIQSLDVIHEDDFTETINPLGEIKLAAGENVLFKVNLITNTEIDALVFHWDFCHDENSTIGQAAIQIPYQLNDNENDCIIVKIERGGEFLNKVDFFINRK